MKLEDQVISFEIAQELQELGVKTESLFYWHKYKNINYVSYGDPTKCICPYNHMSAFTVAELGEMLPMQHLIVRKMSYGWETYYDDMDSKLCFGSTEADSRGKCLIWCIENGIMETK